MQVLLVIAVQILFVCNAKGKGHVMTIRDAVKRLVIPGCQSGQVKLGYTTTETGKSTIRTIVFSPPFPEKPAIVYGLSHLDSSKGENTRITTELSNLSRTGMTLKVKSWKPTLTYDAWVQWMACPK